MTNILELDKFKRRIIAEETKIEAGWVNDPNDLGKETNHGITIGVATQPETKAELVKRFQWNGKMKDLTTEMAYWIYSNQFWDSLSLSLIYPYSETLCRTLFRWGVKSGPGKPATSLQETLNVLNDGGKHYPNIKVDGKIGERTKDALVALIKLRGLTEAMTTLVVVVNSDQIAWMKYISVERKDELNERFTWGWFQRCQDEIFGYLKKYQK